MDRITCHVVDTSVGEHVDFDVQEQTEHLNLVYNEEDVSSRIICDQNSLQIVNVEADSVGSFITRPITMEGNNNLLDIPACNDNIHKTAPFRFKCCDKQTDIVTCMNCGGAYHRQCIENSADPLILKEGRVTCCDVTDLPRISTENELRKKLVREMDEKIIVMQKYQDLLQKVASLQKSEPPDDENKNLVELIRDVYTFMTKEKTHLRKHLVEKSTQTEEANLDVGKRNHFNTALQQIFTTEIFKQFASMAVGAFQSNQSMPIINDTVSPTQCTNHELSQNLELQSNQSMPVTNNTVLPTQSNEMLPPDHDYSAAPIEPLNDKNCVNKQIPTSIQQNTESKSQATTSINVLDNDEGSGPQNTEQIDLFGLIDKLNIDATVQFSNSNQTEFSNQNINSQQNAEYETYIHQRVDIFGNFNDCNGIDVRESPSMSLSPTSKSNDVSDGKKEPCSKKDDAKSIQSNRHLNTKERIIANWGKRKEMQSDSNKNLKLPNKKNVQETPAAEFPLCSSKNNFQNIPAINTAEKPPCEPDMNVDNLEPPVAALPPCTGKNNLQNLPVEKLPCESDKNVNNQELPVAAYPLSTSTHNLLNMPLLNNVCGSGMNVDNREPPVTAFPLWTSENNTEKLNQPKSNSAISNARFQNFKSKYNQISTPDKNEQKSNLSVLKCNRTEPFENVMPHQSNKKEERKRISNSNRRSSRAHSDDGKHVNPINVKKSSDKVDQRNIEASSLHHQINLNKSQLEASTDINNTNETENKLLASNDHLKESRVNPKNANDSENKIVASTDHLEENRIHLKNNMDGSSDPMNEIAQYLRNTDKLPHKTSTSSLTSSNDQLSTTRMIKEILQTVDPTAYVISEAGKRNDSGDTNEHVSSQRKNNSTSTRKNVVTLLHSATLSLPSIRNKLTKEISGKSVAPRKKTSDESKERKLDSAIKKQITSKKRHKNSSDRKSSSDMKDKSKSTIDKQNPTLKSSSEVKDKNKSTIDKQNLKNSSDKGNNKSTIDKHNLKNPTLKSSSSITENNKSTKDKQNLKKTTLKSSSGIKDNNKSTFDKNPTVEIEKLSATTVEQLVNQGKIRFDGQEEMDHIKIDNNTSGKSLLVKEVQNTEGNESICEANMSQTESSPVVANVRNISYDEDMYYQENEDEEMFNDSKGFSDDTASVNSGTKTEDHLNVSKLDFFSLQRGKEFKIDGRISWPHYDKDYDEGYIYIKEEEETENDCMHYDNPEESFENKVVFEDNKPDAYEKGRDASVDINEANEDRNVAFEAGEQEIQENRKTLDMQGLTHYEQEQSLMGRDEQYEKSLDQKIEALNEDLTHSHKCSSDERNRKTSVDLGLTHGRGKEQEKNLTEQGKTCDQDLNLQKAKSEKGKISLDQYLARNQETKCREKNFEKKLSSSTRENKIRTPSDMNTTPELENELLEFIENYGNSEEDIVLNYEAIVDEPQVSTNHKGKTSPSKDWKHQELEEPVRHQESTNGEKTADQEAPAPESPQELEDELLEFMKGYAGSSEEKCVDSQSYDNLDPGSGGDADKVTSDDQIREKVSTSGLQGSETTFSLGGESEGSTETKLASEKNQTSEEIPVRLGNCLGDQEINVSESELNSKVLRSEFSIEEIISGNNSSEEEQVTAIVQQKTDPKLATDRGCRHQENKILIFVQTDNLSYREIVEGGMSGDLEDQFNVEIKEEINLQDVVKEEVLDQNFDDDIKVESGVKTKVMQTLLPLSKLECNNIVLEEVVIKKEEEYLEDLQQVDQYTTNPMDTSQINQSTTQNSVLEESRTDEEWESAEDSLLNLRSSDTANVSLQGKITAPENVLIHTPTTGSMMRENIDNRRTGDSSKQQHIFAVETSLGKFDSCENETTSFYSTSISDLKMSVQKMCSDVKIAEELENLRDIEMITGETEKLQGAEIIVYEEVEKNDKMSVGKDGMEKAQSNLIPLEVIEESDRMDVCMKGMENNLIPLVLEELELKKECGDIKKKAQVKLPMTDNILEQTNRLKSNEHEETLPEEIVKLDGVKSSQDKERGLARTQSTEDELTVPGKIMVDPMQPSENNQIVAVEIAEPNQLKSKELKVTSSEDGGIEKKISKDGEESEELEKLQQIKPSVLACSPVRDGETAAEEIEVSSRNEVTEADDLLTYSPISDDELIQEQTRSNPFSPISEDENEGDFSTNESGDCKVMRAITFDSELLLEGSEKNPEKTRTTDDLQEVEGRVFKKPKTLENPEQSSSTIYTKLRDVGSTIFSKLRGAGFTILKESTATKLAEKTECVATETAEKSECIISKKLTATNNAEIPECVISKELTASENSIILKETAGETRLNQLAEENVEVHFENRTCDAEQEREKLHPDQDLSCNEVMPACMDDEGDLIIQKKSYNSENLKTVDTISSNVQHSDSPEHHKNEESSKIATQNETSKKIDDAPELSIENVASKVVPELNLSKHLRHWKETAASLRKKRLLFMARTSLKCRTAINPEIDVLCNKESEIVGECEVTGNAQTKDTETAASTVSAQAKTINLAENDMLSTSNDDERLDIHIDTEMQQEIDNYHETERLKVSKHQEVETISLKQRYYGKCHILKPAASTKHHQHGVRAETTENNASTTFKEVQIEIDKHQDQFTTPKIASDGTNTVKRPKHKNEIKVLSVTNLTPSPGPSSEGFNSDKTRVVTSAQPPIALSIVNNLLKSPDLNKLLESAEVSRLVKTLSKNKDLEKTDLKNPSEPFNLNQFMQLLKPTPSRCDDVASEATIRKDLDQPQSSKCGIRVRKDLGAVSDNESQKEINTSAKHDPMSNELAFRNIASGRTSTPRRSEQKNRPMGSSNGKSDESGSERNTSGIKVRKDLFSKQVLETSDMVKSGMLTPPPADYMQEYQVLCSIDGFNALQETATLYYSSPKSSKDTKQQLEKSVEDGEYISSDEETLVIDETINSTEERSTRTKETSNILNDNGAIVHGVPRIRKVDSKCNVTYEEVDTSLGHDIPFDIQEITDEIYFKANKNLKCLKQSKINIGRVRYEPLNIYVKPLKSYITRAMTSENNDNLLSIPSKIDPINKHKHSKCVDEDSSVSKRVKNAIGIATDLHQKLQKSVLKSDKKINEINSTDTDKTSLVQNNIPQNTRKVTRNMQRKKKRELRKRFQMSLLESDKKRQCKNINEINSTGKQENISEGINPHMPTRSFSIDADLRQRLQRSLLESDKKRQATNISEIDSLLKFEPPQKRQASNISEIDSMLHFEPPPNVAQEINFPAEFDLSTSNMNIRRDLRQRLQKSLLKSDKKRQYENATEVYPMDKKLVQQNITEGTYPNIPMRYGDKPNGYKSHSFTSNLLSADNNIDVRHAPKTHKMSSAAKRKLAKLKRHDLLENYHHGKYREDINLNNDARRKSSDDDVIYVSGSFSKSNDRNQPNPIRVHRDKSITSRSHDERTNKICPKYPTEICELNQAMDDSAGEMYRKISNYNIGGIGPDTHKLSKADKKRLSRKSYKKISNKIQVEMMQKNDYEVDLNKYKDTRLAKSTIDDCHDDVIYVPRNFAEGNDRNQPKESIRADLDKSYYSSRNDDIQPNPAKSSKEIYRTDLFDFEGTAQSKCDGGKSTMDLPRETVYGRRRLSRNNQSKLRQRSEVKINDSIARRNSKEDYASVNYSCDNSNSSSIQDAVPGTSKPDVDPMIEGTPQSKCDGGKLKVELPRETVYGRRRLSRNYQRKLMGEGSKVEINDSIARRNSKEGYASVNYSCDNSNSSSIQDAVRGTSQPDVDPMIEGTPQSKCDDGKFKTELPRETVYGRRRLSGNYQRKLMREGSKVEINDSIARRNSKEGYASVNYSCDNSSSSSIPDAVPSTSQPDVDPMMEFCVTMCGSKRKAEDDADWKGRHAKKLLRKFDVDKFLDMIHKSGP